MRQWRGKWNEGGGGGAWHIKHFAEVGPDVCKRGRTSGISQGSVVCSLCACDGLACGLGWPAHRVQCAMCRNHKTFQTLFSAREIPRMGKKVSPTIWNVSTLLPFLLTICGTHSMWAPKECMNAPFLKISRAPELHEISLHGFMAVIDLFILFWSITPF